MRLGIDARFYSVAGPGRYVKNLITSLETLDNKNEYSVFLRRENFDKYKPKHKNFKRILADYPWYSFKEQIFMPVSIAKANVDIMHFPHFNVPLLYFGPFVLTIHDLIMHEFSTQRASTRSLPYYKFKRLIYRFLVWWAAKRARKILVPSKFTKEEIVKSLKVSEHKVVVTYEGVDDEFKVESQKSNVKTEVLKKYGIKKPYLFYLGSMYPHKNVERLIEAFIMLKEKYKFSGQLVLTGKKDYFSQRIKSQIVKRGEGSDVIFPGYIHPRGYVPDLEVRVLLEEAEALVFPSLKEGFGLPLLEAMAVGTPIIASGIPAVIEVCEQSAIYFDPNDSDAIAKKINLLLKDDNLKNTLLAEGIKRVENFSWEKMAVETLKVYQSLKIRV